MGIVAITGGSGFVGQHLLALLAGRDDLQIRALIHRHRPPQLRGYHNLTPVEGDLLKPKTLNGLLQPGCTVVNLAYLSDQSDQENLRAAANLAEACLQAKIKRLIHCSTVAVTGRAPGNVVNEETPCRPVHVYETTKLAIEKILIEKSGSTLEVVILRPTTIFGAGGKNLLKLADELNRGRRAVRYIKSCLFNRRKMNLVYVGNVAAAIAFLIDVRPCLDREIFIVSHDEHPSNNYRTIEQYLLARWDYPDYPLPCLPLPPLILSTLLKLAGRPNSNPARVYEGQKLVQAGFEKPISFEAGLTSFADWYKEQFLKDAAEG